MIPKHLPKDVNGIWMPIEDCIEFQEGPGVRKYQYREAGIKLLNGGNINDNVLDLRSTERYISEEEAYGKYKHFLVDAGDLLIASSGIVVDKFDKKIAYAKKEHLPLCMNTSTIRFKSKDESKLHLNYFRHFLATNYFKKQLGRLITGSAQLNFGPSHLKQMYVPLPSLEEQKRIAAILDKADAIRRKRQQAIELTDQLLCSVFLDMFGDPVTNPKGWELVSFASVGQLDRGKSKHRPRNDPVLLGGEHPLIQTGDVANSGGYITAFKSTYSDVGLKQSKKWPSGTLCITIAANIANTGILEFDACFPDSVVGFTPNELVTVEYAQTWLGFLQKIIEDAAPESAQKNINLAILRDLEIPLPNIKMQNKFSQIVHKVKSTKGNLIDGEVEIKTLLNSLTQQAFSGELKEQSKAA